MNFKNFFKECHEKEVFKNLSIYVVSSWVLIQVFSEIWEPFGLPKISMTYLLLVLLIGFPFYVYLLWRYRLKPLESKLSQREGLKFKSKSDSPESGDFVTKKRKIHLPGVHFYSPFQRMYFTFLFVISLGAIFSTSLIVRANFLNEDNIGAFAFGTEDTNNNNRIAVLEFENNTANEQLDVVGKMAADWLINGITQNKVGQVISPKIIEEYSKVFQASILPSGNNEAILTDYLKPSKIVTGSYYLNNNSLWIQSAILNEQMNQTIISFDPVECDPSSPLDCVDELKQRLLGYLSTNRDKKTTVEEIIPKYDAYQYFLEAKEDAVKNEPAQLQLLEKAIAADSNYFEPKLWRIAYYYNKDEFAVADSLYNLVANSRIGSDRQRNLLYFYEALIKGDNKRAYDYLVKEYNYNELDLPTNSSLMVLGLQFVNKPQDIDFWFQNKEILPLVDKADLVKCTNCEYRYYVQGLANIELKKPEETITMLKSFENEAGLSYIKEVLLRAYVATNNTSAVSNLIEKLKLTSELEEWYSSCLKVGKLFLNNNDTINANYYFDQVLNSIENSKDELTLEVREYLAYIHFYKENYKEAEPLLEALVAAGNDEITDLTTLAMIYLKNGKTNKAESHIKDLDNLRNEYQYGAVDYAIARYYALAQDEDKAMGYLLKAVAAGKRYTPATFQHDVVFRPYTDTPEFKEIMTYWH